jgi:hypothetical protein
MSKSGPWRHFAALQNLIAIGAQRTSSKTTIQEDKPCDHRGIPEPAQKWHHVLATKLAVDFQFGRTP